MRTNVFNQYIQCHSQGAFAMALQMLGCREEARDVLQDACCSLIKQSSLPEQSTQFRMLLFRVVRNKAIDRLRARKVRQASEYSDEVETEQAQKEDDNPQQYWQQQQELSRLQHALLALSNEQRDIILLKDWQDFSYTEIAEILSIEPGTVMSRLHRARLKLRDLMKKNDTDSDRVNQRNEQEVNG